MLSEPHGFLKSPDYPAASKYRACHWRIEPRPRAAVHLTLHDLASTHRRQGVCDGGLQIAVSIGCSEGVTTVVSIGYSEGVLLL